MSEQNPNEQNPTSHTPSRRSSSRNPQHRTSSNPLGDSPLMEGGNPPPTLPAFPPAVPETPTSSARQPSRTSVAQSQQTSLLYNTPPSPDFLARPFERQKDRQTIYIDAYKAGALDALTTLVFGKNKTKMIEEMVDDLIAKYEQVLQENEEFVRKAEERYREKHNL